MRSLEGPALADPKQLYFTTGKRRKLWHKNVVCIGLSGGFLEPLESTSIHLIQEGITALIEHFPVTHIDALDADEYNRRMDLNFERVRDFLLLHYVATQRDDSEMWRYFSAMQLPDSLQEKMDAWSRRGYVLEYEIGVFLPPSWIAVMLGQNLMPAGYDPRVNRYPPDKLFQFAEKIQTASAKAASETPTHIDFIAQYGAASKTAPLTAAPMHSR